MIKEYRISSIADEHAYHNTAIMVYFKAVNDVLGNVSVRLGNSLNQGYFTYIGGMELTSGDINKIRKRMETLIEHDAEIVTECVSAERAKGKWTALGCREKAELLDVLGPDDTVRMSVMDGYTNCLYGDVLPSAGYVNLFELRPYRKGMLLRLPNALHPDSIPAYRDDDKLYDAYADSKRMRRHTGLEYVADLNSAVREGRIDDIILASEELQSRQLKEFAQMTVEGGKRIVLIAGPSSSGKTTTAKRICQEIAALAVEPLYLGTDDYFLERKDTPLGPDGKPDFEGLGALDLDLFNHDMEALLAGEEADIPEFNFITGEKEFGKRITSLRPGQIIVIEGIHSLNDVLTSRIPADWKFKIYISPLTQIGVDRHNRVSTADARLLRRIVRDNQFRGYDAEKTLESWPKVRAGESVNIFPYSSSADVVFNSSTAYETNMLRTYAEPLLNEIGEDSPMYEEAQRILNFTKYFEKITSSDTVPLNSILREFIGGQQL